MKGLYRVRKELKEGYIGIIYGSIGLYKNYMGTV